jgi:exodeoxyribonuclease VII small subunit
MTEKQISYEDAFKELQNIHEDIKNRKVDIDGLSLKVKQARELVDVCNKRIKEVEIEINEIVESSKQSEEEKEVE